LGAAGDGVGEGEGVGEGAGVGVVAGVASGISPSVALLALLKEKARTAELQGSSRLIDRGLSPPECRLHASYASLSLLSY